MDKPSFIQRILLAFVIIFGSTQAFADTSSGFDVNDVSILFSIRDGEIYPYINLETDGLISKNNFDQVILFETPSQSLDDIFYLDSDFLKSRRYWNITALRLNICGDVMVTHEILDPIDKKSIFEVSKAPGCQPRLRIVAQPFNNFGQPLPTAIHLLYDLDDSLIATLVELLAEIKKYSSEKLGIDTTNFPLMVHPGLREAQIKRDPTLGRAIRSFVQTALNLDSESSIATEKAIAKTPANNLSIVTLNVQSTFNHWRLVGGKIENGNWIRFVTPFSKSFNKGDDPTLRTGVEVLACDLNPSCVVSPTYFPKIEPSEGFYLTEIFQDSPEWQQIQVPGHRTKAVHEKAEIIDDVEKVHFFNTNCISCHQSANLRDYEGLHLETKSPTGITPFVSKRYLNQQVSTVINFGYQGVNPRISTRTASESVAAANLINKTFGLKNPAKERSLNDFWKCLVVDRDFLKCI